MNLVTIEIKLKFLLNLLSEGAEDNEVTRIKKDIEDLVDNLFTLLEQQYQVIKNVEQGDYISFKEEAEKLHKINKLLESVLFVDY